MTRVVLFLVAVGVLALGAVWLANRPGDVTIVWQGRQIYTSVMVAACVVAVIAVLSIVAWSLWRAMRRSPAAWRARRRGKGQMAISRGLIAIGAGDVRGARKYAREANRIAAAEPLALLLRAQTAQLNGDRAGAEQAFRAMVDRNDTKLLGLRGLYVEAQRREDADTARYYAEEAAKNAPALGWAGQAVLEFRCAAADWQGALATLENNLTGRLIDKATYRRQRAVLLTAGALAAEPGDRDTARASALEAVRLAPDLVPAAVLAARQLAEAGELRRAGRIIETAWRRNPHPDLAETYAYLRSGSTAPDRLARVQALVRQPAGHKEGALATARAALDAHEFAVARAALAPYVAQPTQRVAVLMAELEEAEHGDEGRAREWMVRALRGPRDPVWTADGYVSEHWLPVSPVTGRIDAFQWKVPLAELTDERGAVIEDERAATAADAPPGPAGGGETSVPARPISIGGADKPARQPRKPVERPEALIPIMHAPDDPGPEDEAPPEPEESRRRWFSVGSLFR